MEQETTEQLQDRADAGKAPAKVMDQRVPAPLGGMFSRSLDGWAVDKRWLDQIALNDDRVLQLEGYAPDLKLFDTLLDDDVAFSTFQQRRMDVISKPWEVEPGDKDGQSKRAADHLRDQLASLNWDDICHKMLHGAWYGYAVGEPIWEIGRDGLLRMGSVYVPNRAWFAYTNGGQLVMRSNENPEGLPVPDRKFWDLRSGASHHGQHYGVGLAHWCYWPIYFKKNVIKFWALFLEKFGMPTMMGEFPQAWENDDEKLNKLLSALAAIGVDSSVIVPEGAAVKAMEGTRSGSGASSYDQFVDRMDSAITRIVLTQTMTSTAQSAGLGSQQANVHESKGLAVAQADSDLLHESFNNSVARWVTEWNFPGAAIPRVYRKLQDDEDIDSIAERDSKLFAMGWERTDESVAEVYGRGYQRKAIPAPLDTGPMSNPQLPGQQAQPKQLTDQRGKEFALQFNADAPRPLYIQRKLVNSADVIAWAKAQGFATLEPAAELHVTVLYCPAAVDWFELATRGWIGQESVTVQPGGPRVVMALGDSGAVVLRFASSDLEWRHRELLEAGAEHSWPDYKPHVTLTYDAGGVDLEAVEPYQGKLVFGAEIWEPLDAEPSLPTPASVTFAAGELDAIDRIVGALGREAQSAVTAMVAPIRETVAALGENPDPEALRVALLEALERMPADQLAGALADPLVAVRAAEEAGLGANAVA